MITYNSLSIALPNIDQTTVTEWIGRVAESHQRVVGDINYVFCNDEEILDVNRRYLQHDYYTDIITFDYGRGNVLSGDLYISLDTVRSNAELFGKPYDEELHRVLVHGVLHLVGINDKGPGERELMEAAEDAALALRTVE
ncbi:rRNA maturation RNase YbeY [Alloprevotella sp. Lung230]|uniref:rRNA maturation RNase YbeY n=1 Tax=Alloprevotella sp. Lung230 TaxID=2766595 RepID=UPI001655EC15|nr:rRNA maturation RNase YbeY [Alloprevotella sp. Lung230]MBC8626456.1 rRNA maturation RNase YbeY [Alloprevotella sp. Lung230]